MTAAPEDISILRKMTAEPAPDNYSDAELITAIEKYPLETGYDLNAAARDIWELKAANFAMRVDFSVDGGTYSDGQLYERALRMIAYYDSRSDDLYAQSGFSYVTRDDVDPLGNGDYRVRPVV